MRILEAERSASEQIEVEQQEERADEQRRGARGLQSQDNVLRAQPAEPRWLTLARLDEVRQVSPQGLEQRKRGWGHPACYPEQQRESECARIQVHVLDAGQWQIRREQVHQHTQPNPRE